MSSAPNCVFYKYFFRNDHKTDDIRNEPDYENMDRPGSAGEKRKFMKEIPVFNGHSDTELDKEDLDLAPLTLKPLKI